MSAFASRRALVAGLAALPAAAVPALAAICGEPDRKLIALCKQAAAYRARVEGPAESMSDEEHHTTCDQLWEAIEAAIATPAMTEAGRKAKAQLIRDEYAHDPSYDMRDRLVLSLVADLAGGDA
jgi:hypothetical protein